MELIQRMREVSVLRSKAKAPKPTKEILRVDSDESEDSCGSDGEGEVVVMDQFRSFVSGTTLACRPRGPLADASSDAANDALLEHLKLGQYTVAFDEEGYHLGDLRDVERDEVMELLADLGMTHAHAGRLADKVFEVLSGKDDEKAAADAAMRTYLRLYESDASNKVPLGTTVVM